MDVHTARCERGFMKSWFANLLITAVLVMASSVTLFGALLYLQKVAMLPELASLNVTLMGCTVFVNSVGIASLPFNEARKRK